MGGIFTAEDILKKMQNGASLVQLYTSFIYHGPYLINQLNEDLSNLINELGYKNISDVIGSGA